MNNVTLKSQMDTLRVFLRFWESIDAVCDGMAESVESPSLSYDKNRRDDIVSTDKAEDILIYLSKYEYASINHAFFVCSGNPGCGWEQEY